MKKKEKMWGEKYFHKLIKIISRTAREGNNERRTTSLKN